MRHEEGEAKIINQRLSHYGRVDGNPIYRLVWSNDMTEKRFGEFSDFYNDVFLRTVTETREVPKYSYIDDRWILEMLILGTGYEPLFTFESAKGEFLHPTLKICLFLVEQNERMRLDRPSPLSRAAELREQERVREDREVQDFMDQIDSSPIQNALHLREGIGYRGVKGGN